MPYAHLSATERGGIEVLLSQDLSLREIARRMGRHVSTIARELKRNGALGLRYKAEPAQQRYIRVRQDCRRRSSLDWLPLRHYVVDKMTQGWSPEQVAGRLWLDFPGQPRMRVSHETIYRHIYADPKLGRILIPCLRQRKPRRQKRGERRPTRPIIPNRIDIEHRPPEVDTLERYGDWEGDLIIGAQQQGAVLTLVERKSLFVCARPLLSRHAKGVAQAAISALAALPQTWRKTLTLDNGSEFAHHQTMAQALELDTYFAHPYSAWERARNENTNGLLRQYLPKSRPLDNLPQSQLDSIINQINNRPRKKLGYRSPMEVFLEHSVALTT